MMGKLMKQDIQFQFRHGFYYIYAFVTIIYIAILLFIPMEYRGFWSVLVIFTDPGTLGFFFVGTIVMLERNQQLLTYLFITPVKLKWYLCSKILSLSVIAWITSLFIGYFTLGGMVSFFWLTLAVLLCSFFFTSCGLAISVDAPSLNHFMFRAIMLMLLLYIPLLSYLEWIPLWILEVMPSYSALILFDLALSGTNSLGPIRPQLLHVFLLFVWGVVAYLIAARRFNRYILSNTGESKVVSV
ncbi:hypothetical protein [Evansella tamaricis]|uniref:ABC-2 type transporter domain-containing protein n=1 Tax=Evansella tamaricis TaxID=2069301 RepID=A0ABS6JNL3_9BACI|nr:hypothetical protein [Evansella tamaricis]MBU9714789.1 hypothetical protein [Evansella tamaricis]